MVPNHLRRAHYIPLFPDFVRCWKLLLPVSKPVCPLSHSGALESIWYRSAPGQNYPQQGTQLVWFGASFIEGKTLLLLTKQACFWNFIRARSIAFLDSLWIAVFCRGKNSQLQNKISSMYTPASLDVSIKITWREWQNVWSGWLKKIFSSTNCHI